MKVETVAEPAAGVPLAPTGGRWIAPLEAGLRHLVEIPAALLVVAEIGVLLAGVIGRYVFHSPIIWSDELASILFLWLAMLGSVIALRLGEHMRMTAFVGMASSPVRAFLDVLTMVAALTFLLLIIEPAYEFAYEETYITTPALEISNVWRAAALPIGAALMILTVVLRLLRVGNWRLVLSAVALIAVIIGALLAIAPVLHGLGNLNLLIFFVGIVAGAVFAGVPIAFSFGLATFGYLALTTTTPMVVVVGRMDEGMSHLILLAVPLFVFLGLLIEMTGMARAMVAFLASLLGHIRGGLSYVLVGAMYLVSGISGSKAADMAAIAPVLFPEMKERGARPGDLLALLSATGAQTETIPPSIVLITIGSVTGVSITALFTGGMLPGVVLAVGLCLVVWWRYRKEDLSHVRRATLGRDRPLVHYLRPRHCLALHHSSGRYRRCGDGDRGFHHRHRLRDICRLGHLSPLRLAAALANARGDGIVIGRNPLDYRRRNRHGVVVDPVGIFA